MCLIILTAGLILAGCDDLEVEQQHPALSGTVTINNTSPRVGDTLTALFSGNGTGTPSWQWYRDDSPLSGATNNSYTVVSADVGAALKAQVAYADQTGVVASTATAAALPAILPTLTGTVTLNNTSPKVGDTITATYSGDDDPGILTWRWYRGGERITGATGRSYKVVGQDAGKILYAAASSEDYSGTLTSAVTKAVIDERDELTGTVTIDNTSPRVGVTLTATYKDGNGSGTASWQWLRGTPTSDATSTSYDPISGATSNSYTVVEADLDKTLQAEVRYYADKSGKVTSEATAAVAAANTFVAVTGITGVPTTATVGTPLTLTGTVEPSNADNKIIVWSVKDAGTTGATISGSSLTTTAVGTATVTAKITNGKAQGTDFTADSTITVSASGPGGGGAFVAVTSITGVPTTGTVGTLNLTGTVEPAGATNQTIVWTVKDAGTTEATISGSTLTTEAAGEVTVTATITDGTAGGTDYTQDIDITISDDG